MGFMLVQKASMGVTKTKKNYLDLIIFDGETAAPCKMWDYNDELPKVGSIVKVQLTRSDWQGDMQFIISNIRPVRDEDNVDPAEFRARASRSIDEMWGELVKIAESIPKVGYRNVTLAALGHLEDNFRQAPAALGHHHNYWGGLLEHTLSTTQRAIALATPPCNMSLVIAGAILHDIGKIRAYDWKSSMAIEMTDSGRLIGHIVDGVIMLLNIIELSNVDISSGEVQLLQHIIISHHGKLEWGSPVEPMCKEALIVHTADAMDANIWKMDKSINEAKPDDVWVRSTAVKFDLLVKTGG